MKKLNQSGYASKITAEGNAENGDLLQDNTKMLQGLYFPPSYVYKPVFTPKPFLCGLKTLGKRLEKSSLGKLSRPRENISQFRYSRVPQGKCKQHTQLPYSETNQSVGLSLPQSSPLLSWMNRYLRITRHPKASKNQRKTETKRKTLKKQII